MKIEITDRAMWLDRVNKEIAQIKAVRAKRDAQYEEQWRNRPRLFGRKPGPNDKPNPGGNTLLYPSPYAWGTMATLKEMKLALESKGTGTIYFSADELEAATPRRSTKEARHDD